MPLGPAILTILSKKYEPSAFIEKRFQRTDAEGNPVLLFMGTKNAAGQIRGRRYARRLLKDANGKTIKDHWDDKGPVG